MILITKTFEKLLDKLKSVGVDEIKGKLPTITKGYRKVAFMSDFFSV